MHLLAGVNVCIAQIMCALLPIDNSVPEWSAQVVSYCADVFHAQRPELPVPSESPLTVHLLRLAPLLIVRQPSQCRPMLVAFASLFEHCKPQSGVMRAALNLVAFLLSEASHTNPAQVISDLVLCLLC